VVRLKNQIGVVGDASLFAPANYALFSQYFHRNSSNQLSTNGNQCPGANCGYVDVRQQNLGGTNTNGIDITANYRLPTVGTFTFGLNSTYVAKYEYQDFRDGPWNQNVGVYSGTGPVFRWQHTLNTIWTKDQFTRCDGLLQVRLPRRRSRRPREPTTPLDVFGSWRRSSKPR
jgi:iron complex outermembrane receptor protein